MSTENIKPPKLAEIAGVGDGEHYNLENVEFFENYCHHMLGCQSGDLRSSGYEAVQALAEGNADNQLVQSLLGRLAEFPEASLAAQNVLEERGLSS